MVPTLCCWSTTIQCAFLMSHVSCALPEAASEWVSLVNCHFSFKVQCSQHFHREAIQLLGTDTITTHSCEYMETFCGALTSHTSIAWLISHSMASHTIGSIQIIVWTHNPNHSHIIDVKYFRVSQQVNPGHLFITNCNYIKEQGQPQGGCLQELQMQRSQEIPVFAGYSRSYENTLRDLMFAVFVWW